MSTISTMNGVAITTSTSILGAGRASVNGVSISAGGPALVVSDDFDYPNNSDLGSQTGWSTVNDTVVISNVTGTNGTFYGGTQAAARSTATFASNQRCEITCAVLVPGTFQFVKACVRCQSGADTYYWIQTDGTNWFLVKRNAGSQSVIASGTHSLVSGDKIAIDAAGAGASTRLNVQVDTGGGWTNQSGATNVDPGGTYIDNGSAGVGGDGGAAAQGDAFRGYNL